MNKSEFITALQAKTGLAKADVTKLVNAYGEVVIEAVSKGEDVRLIGFGTLAPPNAPPASAATRTRVRKSRSRPAASSASLASANFKEAVK